jgi:hypothetical protein
VIVKRARVTSLAAKTLPNGEHTLEMLAVAPDGREFRVQAEGDCYIPGLVSGDELVSIVIELVPRYDGDGTW